MCIEQQKTCEKKYVKKIIYTENTSDIGPPTLGREFAKHFTRIGNFYVVGFFFVFFKYFVIDWFFMST